MLCDAKWPQSYRIEMTTCIESPGHTGAHGAIALVHEYTDSGALARVIPWLVTWKELGAIDA